MVVCIGYYIVHHNGKCEIQDLGINIDDINVFFTNVATVYDPGIILTIVDSFRGGQSTQEMLVIG